MKTIAPVGVCLRLYCIFLLTISSYCAIAQNTQNIGDSESKWNPQVFLGEVLDSNTLAVLSDAGVFEDYSRDIFQEYKSLFSTNTDSLKFGIGKLKLPLPNLHASWDHKFIKNQSGAEEEEWTNLGYLNLGASMNMLGLPFDAGVQAGMLNNQFNWNLSNVNFDFQHRAFLEKLAGDKLGQVEGLKTDKFKTVKGTSIKKIFSERLPDPSIVNNPFDHKDVDILKTELKNKLLNYIVNHPKYRELYEHQIPKNKTEVTDLAQRKAKQRLDSLSQNANAKPIQQKEKLDSLVAQGKTKVDTAMQVYQKNRAKVKGIKGKVKSYADQYSKEELKRKGKEKISSSEARAAVEHISGQYKQNWEERKKYYGDSLESMKTRFLTSYSKEDLKRLPKDSLMAIVNSKTDKTKLQAIMQKVNRLNLGRTLINDHWFLSENLSLNGGMLGVESGNYAFQAGGGVQRFDYSIFPLLGFSLPTRLPDRSFLYGSAEYHLEESFSLKFSTLNSREKITDQSTPTALERVNNVFLLSGTTRLIGDLRLVVDVAYSRTNGVFIQIPDSNPTQDINKAAGEAKLDYQISKTSLHLNLGYFYVGSQYVSLGNPFIRNGQKGLTFGLTGSVFNRLDFDLTVRDGQSTDDNTLEPKREDLVINGSARLNIAKNFSLSASVFPNFSNYQLNELFAVKSNLWTTSYDLQHTAAGNRLTLINNLTYSNSINQLVLQDSVDLQNYDGLVYYGNLMFKNGMGVDVLAMGFSDTGIFKDGINSTSAQVSLIYNKKNTRLQAGIIYGQNQEKEDVTTSTKTLGLTAGANIKILKKIDLGLQSRLPLYSEGETNTQRLLQEYVQTKLKFNF